MCVGWGGVLGNGVPIASDNEAAAKMVTAHTDKSQEISMCMNDLKLELGGTGFSRT